MWLTTRTPMPPRVTTTFTLSSRLKVSFHHIPAYMKDQHTNILSFPPLSPTFFLFFYFYQENSYLPVVHQVYQPPNSWNVLYQDTGKGNLMLSSRRLDTLSLRLRGRTLMIRLMRVVHLQEVCVGCVVRRHFRGLRRRLLYRLDGDMIVI